MTENIKHVNNPLLEKLNKMPGQKFRLPSKGLLYTNNELDEEVIDGEIDIFPMTALDEIYMKTPTMLYDGSSIHTVFKRCVPQIHKPLELFENDVNYILTCLRKVSYGDFIPVEEKCTKCDAEREEHNIPLIKFIMESKELNEVNVKDYKFKTSNNYEIIFTPIRMKDRLKIYLVNQQEIENDAEKMLDVISDSLSATIEQVDDVTDKNFIKQWISSIPRSILQEIYNKLETYSTWGLDFQHNIKCSSCGNVQTLNTIMNPLYFFFIP